MEDAGGEKAAELDRPSAEQSRAATAAARGPAVAREEKTCAVMTTDTRTAKRKRDCGSCGRTLCSGEQRAVERGKGAQEP